MYKEDYSIQVLTKRIAEIDVIIRRMRQWKYQWVNEDYLNLLELKSGLVETVNFLQTFRKLDERTKDIIAKAATREVG